MVARKVSGKKLKDARLKVGMSQAQLAWAIRTGERNIGRWESESHTPRIDSVAAIAEVTGYDLSYFLEADTREDAPVGDPFRESDGNRSRRGVARVRPDDKTADGLSPA